MRCSDHAGSPAVPGDAPRGVSPAAGNGLQRAIRSRWDPWPYRTPENPAATTLDTRLAWRRVGIRRAPLRRPGLGVFARQAEEGRAELSHVRGPAGLGASALTAAELRLMPMLSTRLSPEIAAEMFLSLNTVKSQAISIYRKLGTPSRSQAVSRLRGLGLLEA
jgi:DNA-binding CsgD family transcriptional regulator